METLFQSLMSPLAGNIAEGILPLIPHLDADRTSNGVAEIAVLSLSILSMRIGLSSTPGAGSSRPVASRTWGRVYQGLRGRV